MATPDIHQEATSVSPTRMQWHSKYAGLISIALFLTLICYTLHVMSPLRLTVDAAAYLEMADAAASGQGFVVDGKPSYLPKGYPAVISLLVRLGLTHPGYLIAVNIVAIVIAAAAGYWLYVRAFGLAPTLARVLTLIWLCQWGVIKYFAHPLSEMLFMAVVNVILVCLVAAAKYRPAYGAALIVAAAGMIGVAISIRTVGLTLLAPLAVSAYSVIMSHPTRNAISKKTLIAVSVLVVFAVLAGLFYFFDARTIKTYTRQAGDGTRIVTTLWDRLEEAGELVMNAPVAKLPWWAPVRAAGLLLAGVFTLSIFRRRVHSVIDVFVLAYIAVVLCWPYRDLRFWVPIVPLLTAYLAAEVLRWGRPVQTFATVYALAFVLAGTGGLVYSLWLTFSGDAFPQRFGGGSMQKIYSTAYSSRSTELLTPQEQLYVKVLRRYR